MNEMRIKKELKENLASSHLCMLEHPNAEFELYLSDGHIIGTNAKSAHLLPKGAKHIITQSYKNRKDIIKHYGKKYLHEKYLENDLDNQVDFVYRYFM